MVNISKVRNHLSVLNPIESHSQNVVLASIISGGEFRISHIEMIQLLLVPLLLYRIILACYRRGARKWKSLESQAGKGDREQN